LDIQELLEFLNLTHVTEQHAARAALPGDETEARLLAAIGSQPLHVDDISIQTELPIEKVSATLALMELKGMVRQMGGMHYVAIREANEDYGI
jgi:DNA processing protein